MVALIVLAIAGLVATAIGIALDPARGLLAYLVAYATVATLAMGALVLLLIGYVTRARWLAAVRRLQEALAGVFPVLAVGFVPIAIGVYRIYAWADPPADLKSHEREILAAKAAWLAPTGFIVRGAIYLAVFVIAAEVLRRRSRRRDQAPPAKDADEALRGDRVFAAAMLPPVGLALTFAAVDWLMSLQPLWFSTMFPVYIFASGFSGAIAALAITAARVRVRVAAGLTGHHFHAIGRMLFAFVVFWAYTAYFQGFLIQIANRPAEVTFFVARSEDGWDYVLLAIAILRFALPFVLLLPRSVKYRPRYVAIVATIVLAGHVLEMLWLVLPASGAVVSWMDIAALVGVGAGCLAFAAWRLRRAPIVPIGDPLLAAGLRYESPT